MPRSLADGHTKFTILTEEPVDPEAPTAAELNAGIDASCRILASDFTWGAGDSDKIAEKALCVENNANSLGASNFNGGITPFRYFDATTKNAHATEDAVFAAVKVKGTELWAYARRTAKKSTEAWAAADEIFLGGHVLTDEPQPPSDLGGYIKTRVPLEFQDGYPNIVVAASGG
jgi:hypothetical protein